MFNEDNTIEQMSVEALASLGWRYVAAEDLPRRHADVMVEPMVKDALIRLNPEIAEDPDRADEIIYWKGIYAAQQAAGLANTYGPDSINKGDLIKKRGAWYQVVRVNPKSVSVQVQAGATWTHKIAYHQISEHRAGDPQVYTT